MSQPALQCFDSSLYDFLEKDFEIIKLNDTCSFSEGPVWSKEGFFLFSDIPQNAVYKIGRVYQSHYTYSLVVLLAAMILFSQTSLDQTALLLTKMEIYYFVSMVTVPLEGMMDPCYSL
jgi:hypothetical protein